MTDEPGAAMPVAITPIHLDGTPSRRTPNCIAFVEDTHSAWRVWHDRRVEIGEILCRLNPHLRPMDIAAVLEQCEWLTTIPDDAFDVALRDAVAQDEAWRKASPELTL